MKISKSEVMEYAVECRRQKPDITKDELRGLLRARFIDGMDPLAEAVRQNLTIGTIGSVCNPLDWIKGLSSIFLGLGRLFSDDDISGVEDIIEGVVIIIY